MSQPTRLSYWVIPILGIMTGNAALSLDMYLPAFPAIAGDFGVAEADVQVTMSAFLAGFALGQVFYGPLSDRFGRRPVILSSLLVYGVISALCALSPEIDDLVFWRAVQGLAGASGSVLGRAVIRDVYEGPRLAKAMSMLMLVLTAGPMIAPLLGSFVLELFDWRAVFWTLASYAMLWSLLIAISIPETWPKKRRLSIHPIAVMTMFKSVISHRQAMGYILTAGFGFAGMFAYISATPFIYMNVYGISPREYALFFASNIAAMALSSFVNGKLSGRYHIDQLLTLYTWVLIVSSAFLLMASLSGIGGVWGLVVPLFFYVGCLSPLAANAISGTLQHFGHAAGTASSVFGVFQFGMGSLAGWLVASLNDGSPSPMGFLIGGCALGAVLVFNKFAKAF